jgi:type IV pilus assembly protein PilE
MNNKGVTIIELLIVIAIIGILAAIAIPGYIGQQTRAARAEAFANLESLRVFEEQLFAETGAYAASTGTCAKDNAGNVAAIQGVIPGFQPGTGMNFSYCIVLNQNLAAAAQTPCFAARAYGNSNTRVDGENFNIDCTNNKDF